ncbi:hypothetical protein LCGC14_2311940, partial [marine sediment metagenome]
GSITVAGLVVGARAGVLAHARRNGKPITTTTKKRKPFMGNHSKKLGILGLGVPSQANRLYRGEETRKEDGIRDVKGLVEISSRTAGTLAMRTNCQE